MFAGLSAVGRIWALLVGVGLLMLGNGLQGTLLGVRASLEGYGSDVVGWMMSGFFLGFLLGAALTSRAVRKVGHVRVFAALASLASISILVHGLVIDPVVWSAMRLITGASYAGIFVVAESWLNDAARNETRGQVLAVYMLTSFAGMGGGQLMLNLGDPETTQLFILVSVLISAAAIPLLLSATPTPTPAAPVSVGIVRLFRVSPLGAAGTFLAGLINGSVFGMGAVYGLRAGLDVSEVAVFMSVMIVGAAVLQWPIGKLSDLFDRRRVILATSLGASAFALAAGAAAGLDTLVFLALTGLFGGLGLTLHALCLAYTNDYLEPTELVGASSGLVVILALGSITGPPVVGWIMGTFGPAAYFPWLAGVSFCLALYTIWRMTQRVPLATGEQGPFLAMTGQATGIAVATAEQVHAEEVHADAGDHGASGDEDAVV